MKKNRETLVKHGWKRLEGNYQNARWLLPSGQIVTIDERIEPIFSSERDSSKNDVKVKMTDNRKTS